jgi:dihydroxyacetone kinase-like protein
MVYGEVATMLAERGVRIVRRLVGNYVTSLDMAGLSITVTRVTDEMIRLWDAPVRTPGLRWGA